MAACICMAESLCCPLENYHNNIVDPAEHKKLLKETQGLVTQHSEAIALRTEEQRCADHLGTVCSQADLGLCSGLSQSGPPRK